MKNVPDMTEMKRAEVINSCNASSPGLQTATVQYLKLPPKPGIPAKTSRFVEHKCMKKCFQS